jgi:hypothetical protein
VNVSVESVAIIAAVALVAFMIGRASNQLPAEPQNVNDCVLEGLKGGAADRFASAAVEMACIRKFGLP